MKKDAASRYSAGSKAKGWTKKCNDEEERLISVDNSELEAGQRLEARLWLSPSPPLTLTCRILYHSPYRRKRLAIGRRQLCRGGGWPPQLRAGFSTIHMPGTTCLLWPIHQSLFVANDPDLRWANNANWWIGHLICQWDYGRLVSRSANLTIDYSVPQQCLTQRTQLIYVARHPWMSQIHG